MRTYIHNLLKIKREPLLFISTVIVLLIFNASATEVHYAIMRRLPSISYRQCHLLANTNLFTLHIFSPGLPSVGGLKVKSCFSSSPEMLLLVTSASLLILHYITLFSLVGGGMNSKVLNVHLC